MMHFLKVMREPRASVCEPVNPNLTIEFVEYVGKGARARYLKVDITPYEALSLIGQLSRELDHQLQRGDIRKVLMDRSPGLHHE